MNDVARKYPKAREIHVVLDNLSTHHNADVWLAKHPNVTLHFTPVGNSWINQIENWFGIATRQAIRRGSFTSLGRLIREVNDYIKRWNADPEPFTWTTTAAEIMAKSRYSTATPGDSSTTTSSRPSKADSIAGQPARVGSLHGSGHDRAVATATWAGRGPPDRDAGRHHRVHRANVRIGGGETAGHIDGQRECPQRL
jgi:hypothetical protein